MAMDYCIRRRTYQVYLSIHLFIRLAQKMSGTIPVRGGNLKTGLAALCHNNFKQTIGGIGRTMLKDNKTTRGTTDIILADPLKVGAIT